MQRKCFQVIIPLFSVLNSEMRQLFFCYSFPKWVCSQGLVLMFLLLLGSFRKILKLLSFLGFVHIFVINIFHDLNVFLFFNRK